MIYSTTLHSIFKYAGLDTAKSDSRRVRGWREFSAGYVLEPNSAGPVIPEKDRPPKMRQGDEFLEFVAHYVDDGQGDLKGEERRQNLIRKVKKMVEVLREHKVSHTFTDSEDLTKATIIIPKDQPSPKDAKIGKWSRVPARCERCKCLRDSQEHYTCAQFHTEMLLAGVNLL